MIHQRPIVALCGADKSVRVWNYELKQYEARRQLVLRAATPVLGRDSGVLFATVRVPHHGHVQGARAHVRHSYRESETGARAADQVVWRDSVRVRRALGRVRIRTERPRLSELHGTDRSACRVLV